MRLPFKTDYSQDIKLFGGGGRVPYGLLTLAVLGFPFIAGDFYIGELGGVYIFAIVGVSLMLLTGYTGLISLSHAAFLGIGAYSHAFFLAQGLPFFITMPIAGILAAIAGVAIGVPTLRMSGLYLAIATLAFGMIVNTVFQKWTSVTGGFLGFVVPMPKFFGVSIGNPSCLYYVSLFTLIAVLLLSKNILRMPLGRAMVAIRDSEISAQSMGINLARYKTTAFALSAGIAGIAGALYAHYIRVLAPDAFDLLISIQFLVIIFVGGIGSLQGAIYGAIFVRLLPQAIAIMRDDLPFGIGRLPGLEPALFGLVVVLVILFEPAGIYGRWVKFKYYLEHFPLARASTFRRQRVYTKSERLK